MNPMQKFLDFLVELEIRHIHYRLRSVRAEAVMVEIRTPGERWEIEFFADGDVEVETFRSQGGVVGGPEAEEKLAVLLREME